MNMYCPSCGAQNVDPDARFCRGCGKDLRLVSQALAKRISWWKYLATKTDDYFEAKRQKESRNNGLVYISHAVLLLIVSTYFIINWDRNVLYIILVALSLLGFGIRDYWIYKRSLSHEYHPDLIEVKKHLGDLTIYKSSETPDKEGAAALTVAKPTEVLAPADSPRIAPPSITEQTTRHLQENGETRE